MSAEQELTSKISAMRQLYRVMLELNRARDPGAVLQAVVDGVASSVGYEYAAVVALRADGDLEVAAASGPPHAPSLVGQVADRATWDALLAVGDVWGPLRFVKYQIWPSDIPGGAPGFDALPEDEPWQPMDGLLVPLQTPESDLVGVLSVDKPIDGRQPAPWQDELLSVYAAQAAIAIDNARLHAETVAAVERLQVERRALRVSEERFRQMFDSAPSGMALVGMSGPEQDRFVRVNQALCDLLGDSVAAMQNLTFADIASAEDCALLADANDFSCVDVRLTRGDQSVVWVSVRASLIANEQGEPQVRLFHFEDVDDRTRREQHLARMANHDALTGLPNRPQLYSRLLNALKGDESVALLFCDLDDFKDINDHYGHHIGDTVLIEVARRLSSGVRGGDVVARLGGDEFVVLACNLTLVEARNLAVRLSRLINGAVPLDDGAVISPSASFGVSWAPKDGHEITADDMLVAADREMYKRKRARRSTSASVLGGHPTAHINRP